MGLISLRPATMRSRVADNTPLSVGSGIAATCIVAALFGAPLLVVLGIIALVVRPGHGVLHPALMTLLVVAICWAVLLVSGLVLTAIGRRAAQREAYISADRHT